MEANRTCEIAIVGCGTVGGATALRLTEERELLQSRSGIELNLKYIVDVDFARARDLGLDASLFEESLDTVLADPDLDVVVELIGGTTVARETIRKALEAGKHVVTANKALMAHHGTELLALARSRDRALAFEASCAGGVPIIRALTDGLISNRIDALYGIVNGTCNYILTQMIQKGESYEVALGQAQKTGLAEADPTLDVSGLDSAHKVAILGALAFGSPVDFESIYVEGIDGLDVLDVSIGLELGYVVKLLAIAQRLDEGICLRVRPAFIGRDHPLAWVSGPFNAVSVYGHAVGHTMYYGRGAGGSPTASAILADIVSVTLGTVQAVFRQLPIWPDRATPLPQWPVDRVTTRYYLRLMAEDRPGVLAGIARILGDHDISISSVLQKELPGTDRGAEPVPVVITTHRALEKSVRTALAQIDALGTVRGRSVCLGIVDEHEELLE